MTYRIEHDLFGTIGHERLKIRCHNGQTIIERVVDVEVRMLMAALHRRRAVYVEVWQDDHLIRFTGRTDDNGKRSFLRAGVGENLSIRIDTEGDRRDISQRAIPTDPWHRRLIGRTELFDRVDGRIIAVSVTDAGAERLRMDDHWTDSQKFVVSGERDQVIWFDDHTGIWLKSKIRHPSGDIVIIRQNVDIGAHWTMSAKVRPTNPVGVAQD
ncbi:MAG: DUF6134 family protein [Pseudomonadota bacterium]